MGWGANNLVTAAKQLENSTDIVSGEQIKMTLSNVTQAFSEETNVFTYLNKTICSTGQKNIVLEHAKDDNRIPCTAS